MLKAKWAARKAGKKYFFDFGKAGVLIGSGILVLMDA